MTHDSTAAREEILDRVQAQLGRAAGATVPTVPAAARIASRPAEDRKAELDRFLAEIIELGGHARRLSGSGDLAQALAELVEAEQVRGAVRWQTQELRALGLDEILAALGVQVTPPDAGSREIAGCDLGITGADAALAETGTLLLCTGPERPRLVSLLPRVHLAILSAAALCSDLQEALGRCRGNAAATLITGPSRTSDIELTLTIGVHGPKALYVWVLE